VASTSSSDTFGALGLVLSLYLLEFGVVYGAIVEPYTVADHDDHDRAASNALAAALTLSLLLALGTCGASLLASGQLAVFLVVTGLATPGLLLQVAARGLLIARGRTGLTMSSNLVWAGVQVALSVVAWQAGSSLGFYLAWVAGAWASAVFCLLRLGVPVRVRGWRDWFRTRRQLALSWTGDQLAQSGLAQITVFTLGAVAGLSAVGAFRGALQLTGPATVVVTGLRLVMLPGAARRARASDGSLDRGVKLLALGFPLLTLLLVAPFLLIPTSLGEQILGETWTEARAVLPWVLVMRMASTVTTAQSIGMRAMHDYRATLRLRLLGGVATVVLCTAAGAVGGAMGASIALAVVSLLLIPLWQRSLERQIRHDRARRLREHLVEIVELVELPPEPLAQNGSHRLGRRAPHG
jgi:O-antigen/teichoic acid export membrane protein